MQTFQTSTGWQLDAKVTPTPHGHHLMLSRFVPATQRAEHQVKFSGTFSVEELQLLRDELDKALDKSQADGQAG